MDEYIYYMRDCNNRPMITVCLMQDENGKYARGVAICSLSETSPCKETGRMYARGRAIRAFTKANLGKESQCSPINRFEAYASLEKANQPLLLNKHFHEKSIYNPKLNLLELKFIAKRNPDPIAKIA